MSEQYGIPPDVEATMSHLDQLIADAKAVPLSSSVMVNRGDIETILQNLRHALPDELTQARWVVRERDEILLRAKEDAERLVADAQQTQAELIAEQNVVAAANDEAERIVTDARDHARKIRLEAEDYVDAKLANFEVVLTKTLSTVERGRAKLRGALETDELDPVQLGDMANDEDDL
jgi:vacuolar-type H+-ATPase subunit H